MNYGELYLVWRVVEIKVLFVQHILQTNISTETLYETELNVSVSTSEPIAIPTP
jgi:hypothetical protein